MGNLEIPSISCALVRGSGEYRNAQPRPRWGDFSPTSGSSRKTGVEGANPPRRGPEKDSEIRWRISRPPSDHMRLAADPGVSLMRIPAPSRVRFRDFRNRPGNRSKRRKPTATETRRRFCDSQRIREVSRRSYHMRLAADQGNLIFLSTSKSMGHFRRIPAGRRKSA